MGIPWCPTRREARAPASPPCTSVTTTPLRLRSFRGWLGDEGWREVILVGDRPLRRVRGAAWHRVRRPAELLARYRAGDRVFGCGNVAGLPLALFEKESIS